MWFTLHAEWIFSIYCTAYLDNKATKNEINESTSANEFSSFIKAFFISKKSSDHHYKTRTKLLQKIFSNEKYVNKISENAHTITIDCKTGIAGFFEDLVNIDSGGIASIEITGRCTGCNYECVWHSAFMPLKVSICSNINLIDVERYISFSNDITFTCRECGGISIGSRQIKNVIALEVEPVIKSDKTNTKAVVNKKYAISQLKEEICVHGNMYNLFGVIEHKPQAENFVAHVKRNNGIWQTIDDLKNEACNAKRIISTPMYVFMLFYVKQTV